MLSIYFSLVSGIEHQTGERGWGRQKWKTGVGTAKNTTESKAQKN